VFEALPKSGGLNEYGLATYKTVDNFAQHEIDWLLSIGGIAVKHGMKLGEQITLAGLSADFDAVFLGMGLGGVNALGMTDESLDGVGNAVEFIAGLRQAASPADVPVGKHMVVLGGGMTAIDAAVQSKKLGAEQVTIVYRREQAQMPASEHEQQWSQTNGVTIRTHGVLKSLQSSDGNVTSATFASVKEANGQLAETGDTFTLPADMVLKAIGQTLVQADLGAATLKLTKGRIAVDAQGRTSLPLVWAGGDCTHGGKDLTVEAVEHGKIAAQAMHSSLMGAPEFARQRVIA
jgi:dihydropyrimidine dehydrogenase (NAD+) subunit PreT